jgi:hypothetical protein
MAGGDTYKIVVEVEGAPSGSDALERQQGGVPEGETPVTKDKTKPKRKSALDLLEDKIGKSRFDTIKKTTGIGTAAGFIALDLYQQDRSFRGDSNRNLRINEGKKWLGTLGATGGLLVTGNFVGAALFVGYTALGLAKENRELINTRAVDKYQSNYYQERLIKDITKRSR